MTTLFKMGYEIFFVRLYLNANTLSMWPSASGSWIQAETLFSIKMSLKKSNKKDETGSLHLPYPHCRPVDAASAAHKKHFPNMKQRRNAKYVDSATAKAYFSA
jgi:hypothetical protein